MIHKEGYKLLGSFLVIIIVANLLVYFLPIHEIIKYVFFGLSCVFYAILLQFFRNPKRKTPVHNNNVIAPADGKVVVIEEVYENEYLKDQRIQVSIFMSPFNVHVNRYPISGRIDYVKYHPGSFLVAWHPKSSTENERTTLVVENGKSVKVLFRQIAGALAKRIICYPSVGDIARQGEEFGFIKFGSRVDIFLPIGTKINVKLGDKVTGGESVIAEF
jgi:phosphatidylserine decarboxylase